MKNLLIIALIFASFKAQAQTEIFNEDFESGIPATFTIINNDGHTVDNSVIEFDPAWISLEDPTEATNHIAGSTSFFSPVDTADRWLITPQITLGSYGNILNWDMKSHDPSFPDGYLVLVSTTDNQLSSFTDTVYYVYQEFADWSTKEINLSDLGYDNQSIHIAFINNTADGFKLYLDNIIINEEDPVSITELSSHLITVFPNPALNTLNIESSGQIAAVEIQDCNGVKVRSILNQFSTIDVQNLSAGVYFIKVTHQDGSVSTKRFVKA